jgi:serpin B
MWTCSKCGEKLEDQFDSCWKCAGSPEQSRSGKGGVRHFRRFFLAGLLFDVALIAIANLLPASWLQMEVRNFAVMVHYPFLTILNNVNGPVTGILVLIVAAGVLGSMWGFLIYRVTDLVKVTLQRASQRQRRLMRIGFCVLSVAVVSCGIILSLPATPIPFTPSPQVKAVVDGNTTFALDLYQQLKERPGNLFFSPFSISTALAMTSGGAHGRTEMEMTNVLHLNLPPEQLHAAFKTLLERAQKIQRWNRIALRSANSLWRQNDSPFKAEFSRLVAQNYFAESKSLDFKNAPEFIPFYEPVVPSRGDWTTLKKRGRKNSRSADRKTARSTLRKRNRAGRVRATSVAISPSDRRSSRVEQRDRLNRRRLQTGRR